MSGTAVSTRPAALALLALLVALDVALVALHVAKPYFPALRPHFYSLEADRGLAEWYQYFKQAGIVLGLLACWRSAREWPFVVWSATFAWLLIDDSFELHERAGEAAAIAWSLPAVSSLRPQDIGEILYALAAALSILSALAISLRYARRGAAAAPSVNLVALLAALAFCGVVIDAVHVVAYFAGSRLAWILTVIEDGGELFVMSVIAAYCWHLAAGGWRADRPASTRLAALDVGRTVAELAARRRA